MANRTFRSKDGKVRIEDKPKSMDELLNQVQDAARTKKTLNFSQTMTGKHFISDGENEIAIDIWELEMKEVRNLINGMGNILGTLAGMMHRLESNLGDTKMKNIKFKIR